MMRSGNPALRGNIFTGAVAPGSVGAMTIRGTVNKTLLLLMLTVISAGFTWGNPVAAMPFMIPAYGSIVPKSVMNVTMPFISITWSSW